MATFGNPQYAFEFPFTPAKPWKRAHLEGDTLSTDRSLVRIEVDEYALRFRVIECVSRVYGKGRNFISRMEEYIHADVHFYVKELLLPRGQYQLLHHDTAHVTMSREMIQALMGGELPLKLALNCVSIMLPLVCKLSPEVTKILRHLKPTFLEAPAKPKRRASHG